LAAVDARAIDVDGAQRRTEVERIAAPDGEVGGAALALVYAVIDEVHQSRVPTRNGALSDVAIDALGIGIASIVLAMAFNRRGRT
jgi:VanZ family protein